MKVKIVGERERERDDNSGLMENKEYKIRQNDNQSVNERI